MSPEEQEQLLSSLDSFLDQNLIRDVMEIVRGGKEATVLRCRAGSNKGPEFYAAKVYRPRRFRNLRNDKIYREGRPILTEGGRAVKKTDSRLMRAVGKKTAFGVPATRTSS